jgi:DNA-binding MarR family transcriptional regulator
LTAQQASVLDHLDEHRPPRVSELAAHMDVTEATMSIHLSRLEQGGYVKRVRDANDGRRVLLQLTVKGKRVKSENSVFDPALTRELISLVPPGQLDTALAGLETLARAAQALMRRRHLQRKKKSQ